MLGELFRQAFSKRPLSLARTRSNGQTIVRGLDAVSQDEDIVAEIKSHRHTEKAFANTRFPPAMLACRYLELCGARTKLMVFTDAAFCRRFKAAADGLLASDIEVVWADLAGNRFTNT